MELVIRLAAALAAAAAAGAGGGRAEAHRLPAFVWRPIGSEGPLPEAWVEAFGGVNVERHEEAEEARAQGLDFYVGHAPGRDDLHIERDSGTYPRVWAEWFESRDSELLVRDPCLSDPAVRGRVFQQLERTLEARGGDHDFGVSLGDEVSVTPWGDPVDLCRSEHCERAFLERFPDARGAPFPDTDSARRALVRGETTPIGAWLRRRAFHHDVLADLVEDLALRARELAPGTRIGLLGLTGTTAFGGLSVERAVLALDFLEVYPTRDARELFLTLRDEQPALCTVIVGDTTPVTAAWRAWEHWVRGGDGWIVYDSAALAASPEHVERIARAIADARAADERLRAVGLAAPPRPSGVALVASDASRRVAWLRDAARDGFTWPNRLAGYQARNGTRERAQEAWLRLFEDAGALPGAVPLAGVGAATAERFPLLVLCHVLVASDAELDGVRAHLAAGGRILVEGDLGWIDPTGRRRAADPLEAWEEDFEGRVLAPPDGLSRYLRERLVAGSGTRRAASEHLAAAGVRPAPVRVEGEDGVPWLVAAARVAAEDAWVVRALPNPGAEEDRRARLGSGTRCRVVPEEGRRVEWIHPSTAPDGASVEVAGGDALVLVVR